MGWKSQISSKGIYMKLQYWGTAASEGWPALFCRCDACQQARQLAGKNIRTRSQALVDDALLLDFPADTYFHSLQYGTDLSHIAHILITHSHEDHFYPLDMILRVPPYGHNQAVPKARVYGNARVMEMLNQAIAVCGYPEREVLRYLEPVVVSPYTPFQAGEYTVTALLADHIPNEDCYLYLIQREGKTLLYAHDTGVFPKETWEYLQGIHIDLLSIDCTFVTSSCDRNHLGLPNVVAVRDRLRAMGCLDSESRVVINHFSHNIPVLHDKLSQEADKFGIITAYDGFTITV